MSAEGTHFNGVTLNNIVPSFPIHIPPFRGKGNSGVESWKDLGVSRTAVEEGLREEEALLGR